MLTNRILALPIFALIMWLVYAVSMGAPIGDGGIAIGTYLTDWANDVLGAEWLVAGSRSLLEGWGVAPWLVGLVSDGIVNGVGAVLGFVPQMLVLFLMLAILEDCGYMARVAFIMDRVFRKFGLSGKSFIPMLISSGCGVPGVMATKTIENERDRRMTTMVTTFIPCGAKMPIIALLMGALIGGTDAKWISPLFYFLGVFAVIISAIMLKKTKLFEGDPAPFVMEMPDYHFPSFRSWMLHVWERIRSYIVKAGTIIFASSALVWFLSNFGVYPGTSFGWLPATSAGAEDFLDYSLLAGLGNAIAWIFAPLGFASWRAAAMTVTGLIAKENVVATFASLSALGEATEEDPAMWQSFAAMFGGNYGPMLAFVAFNLLCAPCFAAMGTIRKQMDDPKWFWAAIGYECGFGWRARRERHLHRLDGPRDRGRGAHALPDLPPDAQARAQGRQDPDQPRRRGGLASTGPTSVSRMPGSPFPFLSFRVCAGGCRATFLSVRRTLRHLRHEGSRSSRYETGAATPETCGAGRCPIAKGAMMSWKNFWIFAGGVAAAGAVSAATQSKGVHDGLVKATAACMRAGDAVSSATQSVIDGANDLNAEARRQTKIDAAVKERLAEMEAQIRADVEQKVDAEGAAE